MTVGSPPSRTAMHEFVVPRSIPIVFAMSLLLLLLVELRKSKPLYSRSWIGLPALDPSAGTCSASHSGSRENKGGKGHMNFRRKGLLAGIVLLLLLLTITGATSAANGTLPGGT